MTHPYLRYPDFETVTSSLDPLEDLLTWLEFCTSKEYVTRTLIERHGLSAGDAVVRSEPISAHVGCALSYVRQAFSGPESVAFLPLYYAVLNLLKVYVLASANWNDLASQRTHGASYASISAPITNPFFDERVTLHPLGALSLFYKTITGRQITKSVDLAMSEVYPLIQGVGVEYRLVTGLWGSVVPMRFWFDPNPTNAGVGNARAVAVMAPDNSPLPQMPIDLPCLKDSRFDAQTSHYVGPEVPAPANDIRTLIDPCLLYYPPAGLPMHPLVPLRGGEPVMPEEFPLALAFFHLSSVVRYKPDYLRALRDQMVWPLLLTLKRHGILQALTLFWCFMNQKTMWIHRI